MVTLPLYQPFAFGAVVAAALMVGGVASRLSVEVVLLLVPPALVAVQDAHLGEKSCAFIVARAGVDKLAPPVLRRHLMELGIAEYKLPDRFRLVPALPLTAVGKIDKRRLRDSLATATA